MPREMTFAARPRISLHFAQTLDGRIALCGLRTPLSSRAGFALAHRARAENDAVLVGRATVQVDDPQLAVPTAGARQPRRVVLASALESRLARASCAAARARSSSASRVARRPRPARAWWPRARK